jgi:hypothetical protein
MAKPQEAEAPREHVTDGSVCWCSPAFVAPGLLGHFAPNGNLAFVSEHTNPTEAHVVFDSLWWGPM